MSSEQVVEREFGMKKEKVVVPESVGMRVVGCPAVSDQPKEG